MSASTSDEGMAAQLPPLVKVAMLGDSQVGKTSLMVRYVEGSFDETQLQTQGVNFMEKTVSIRGHEVTFSIWDIGGDKDYESMLPLVCNDAAAILLVFDLTRDETLDSIRDWHRRARERNKCAMPVLVGIKYDLFAEGPAAEQRRLSHMAMQFAEAIQAPLIFCSAAVPIHVTNVFKVILIQLFGLHAAVPQYCELTGMPILCYKARSALTEPRAETPSSACGAGESTAGWDSGRGTTPASTPTWLEPQHAAPASSPSSASPVSVSPAARVSVSSCDSCTV